MGFRGVRKTPTNDGVTVKIYRPFWRDLPTQNDFHAVYFRVAKRFRDRLLDGPVVKSRATPAGTVKSKVSIFPSP